MKTQKWEKMKMNMVVVLLLTSLAYFASPIIAGDFERFRVTHVELYERIIDSTGFADTFIREWLDENLETLDENLSDDDLEKQIVKGIMESVNMYIRLDALIELEEFFRATSPEASFIMEEYVKPKVMDEFAITKRLPDEAFYHRKGDSYKIAMTNRDEMISEIKEYVFSVYSD